jgi:hypothetical protein
MVVYKYNIWNSLLVLVGLCRGRDEEGATIVKISFCRDAFLSGDQEKLLYIPCVVPDKSRSDYLVTVDVDPQSPTYSQVNENPALSLVDHDLR